MAELDSFQLDGTFGFLGIPGKDRFLMFYPKSFLYYSFLAVEPWRPGRWGMRQEADFPRRQLVGPFTDSNLRFRPGINARRVGAVGTFDISVHMRLPKHRGLFSNSKKVFAPGPSVFDAAKYFLKTDASFARWKRKCARRILVGWPTRMWS